jgi:disulfide bond formation protein DsbB
MNKEIPTLTEVSFLALGSYQQAINLLSHNVPQCSLLIFFTCLTPDNFTA